jgi:hypothetical protein
MFSGVTSNSNKKKKTYIRKKDRNLLESRNWGNNYTYLAHTDLIKRPHVTSVISY